MSDLPARALRAAELVELELRRIDRWQDEPLSADQLDFSEAFGADKLSFFQWLQFVLVPRVREIAAEGGDFPSGSMVATYAVRALDGFEEAGDLIGRLAEFDALFGGADGGEGGTVDDVGSVAIGSEPASDLIDAEIGDAIFPVRGYLIGIQVGMPHASRAHLTRPRRDDATFEPRPAFVLDDFHTGVPERRDGCVVVPTHVTGLREDGARANVHALVAVIREDGAWRIDLDRTAALTGKVEDGVFGPV